MAHYNPKKCYFRFAYFDGNFKCPSIDTHIYLGNASELKDEIPTTEGFLYFQDADSYANHGPLNVKGHKLEDGEMRNWQISETESNKKLLDFDGLIQELRECQKLGL